MAANKAADRPASDLRPEQLSGAPCPDPAGSRSGDPGIPGLTEPRLLSTGEVSSLFQATQLSPPRRVAVKVLHDELSSDNGQRFDRERTVTGGLSGQSSVVPLLECGTTMGHEPYLVMPWYERGSLARLVIEHRRLGWREAAFLIEPIAVTLAEVHGRGLVHRNVKPGNILLTDFLLPRVGDFAMCLPVGVGATAADTAPSHFYSAPEMSEPGEADPRADVYGLGAMLWAMVSGQVAFHGYTAGVDARTATARARSHRLASAETPVPDALRDLIARSMAADPAERPANGAIFVSQLRQSAAAPTTRAAINGRSPGAGGPAGVGGPQTPPGQRSQNRRGPDRPDSRPADRVDLDLSDSGPRSVAFVAVAADLNHPPDDTPPTSRVITRIPDTGTGGNTGGTGVTVRSGAPATGTASAGTETAPDACEPEEKATAGTPTSTAAATPGANATEEQARHPESIQADARYVLVLVACITLVVVAMVAAAMVSGR